MSVESIDIRDLPSRYAEEASLLIGKSFCNNPLFIRIFGFEDPQHRLDSLARLYLIMMDRYLHHDQVIGAFQDGNLRGLGVLISPGHCKPGPAEKLQILRALISGNSARMTMGALQWLRFWVRHDPAVNHWHLGPVVVDPEFQVQGIGGLIMKEICRRIDRDHQLAFLEADTPEGVRFYGRFGFQVNAEQLVHRVPTWFMSRK